MQLRKTGKRTEYPKTPIKDPNEKYLIIGSYTSLYGFSSYKIRNRISVDFSICPDEASVQDIYQALYSSCHEKMNMEILQYAGRGKIHLRQKNTKRIKIRFEKWVKKEPSRRGILLVTIFFSCKKIATQCK